MMDMSQPGNGTGSLQGEPISYTCDGTSWSGMGSQRPSNWSTHVIPGIMVSIWATHWTFAIFKAWLTSSKNQPYQAQCTYTLPFLPKRLPVEGSIKLIFSWLAILTQVWWANGHWSANICPAGTAREGHFAITAVHNWQNAWILFGFLVSGMVDVTSTWVTLPSNMPHAMAAAAFGLQAFGLYTGQHQDELDEMVYFVFAMAVAATAVSLMVEMALPEAFWVGCVKAYTLWLQAIWYLVAAHVLFGGSPAWDSLQPVPDMSPAMFVPVVFVFWMNISALGLLFVYLAMSWWLSAHLNEHLASQTGGVRRYLLNTKDSNAIDVKGVIRQQEMLPLMNR